MKKLFAVMMVLCVMLTAAAFAGETAPTAVNWSDHEADAAKIEGQFANVAQTGLRMFVPAEFKAAEIPQDTLDAGTFLVLKTEKNDKAVVNAQIVKTGIDVFKADLQKQGKTLWEMVLNGLPCTQFSAEAEGVTTVCFAFGTEKGTTLVFSFTLADQEPYTSLYKVMAASIQVSE